MYFIYALAGLVVLSIAIVGLIIGIEFGFNTVFAELELRGVKPGISTCSSILAGVLTGLVCALATGLASAWIVLPTFKWLFYQL